jgi:hypothetical protein
VIVFRTSDDGCAGSILHLPDLDLLHTRAHSSLALSSHV